MAPELTLSLVHLCHFTQTRTALEAAGLGARVPTIEILWDNYCTLDPGQLADDLSTLADRVMFHVMWSRHLELDDTAFADYLAVLRRHVDVLRPIAVSDHLCRFRSDGLFMGAGQEDTYDRLDHVCARISRYQDAIRQPLLIENNASLEQPAAKQVAFLHEVIERTGCGVLFDVSNAVVGELNGRGPLATWLPLLAGRTLRCHVGSYTHHDDIDVVIDSHDCDVSRATQDALRALVPQLAIASITYERDFNRTTEALTQDLVRIAECL
jgi:uncharacterized protein